MTVNDEASAPRAWWTLGLLVCLLIMSLVDRIVISLLVRPLRDVFLITDVQFGLLFGTAFAILYALVGLPAARLADRRNRKRLIFSGVMLWSLCTVASAFARSFDQLLLLRAGLAIGEATIFPAAHSLVTDLLPRDRRSFAASVIAAAPFLGSAVTYIGGGFLISALDKLVAGGSGWGFQVWQLTFLAVGLPTIALGLLFGLSVPEPARREVDAPGESGDRPGARNRPIFFAPLVIGAGAPMIVAYAYSAWGPELLMSRYGLALNVAGAWFGVAAAIGPVVGTLFLPALARAKTRHSGTEMLLRTCIFAVLGGSAIFIITPLQPFLFLFLGGYLLGSILLFGAYSSVIVSMQFLAPAHLRATLVAIVTFMGSSFGLGVGPPMVGFLNMRFADGYGTALAWTAAAAGTISVLMLVLARYAALGPQRSAEGMAARAKMLPKGDC